MHQLLGDAAHVHAGASEALPSNASKVLRLAPSFLGFWSFLSLSQATSEGTTYQHWSGPKGGTGGLGVQGCGKGFIQHFCDKLNLPLSHPPTLGERGVGTRSSIPFI